ncbi:MAG: beta-lactamase family protein [Lachnospiraceae bacterium]|nr:beta-lactamase family protein [Lachnospiraceae bacterium]
MNWKEITQLKPAVTYGDVEAAPSDVGYDASRLDMLNKHIQSLIDEGLIWSGSYCLWKDGRVFANAAMGRLATEWQGRERFLPDTLFELQSVGKVFTAIAILKLMEDGILYLGQPVREWLAEFDADGFRDITVLQLLTHTSGICALEGTAAGDDRSWRDFIDEKDPKGTWVKAVAAAGLHAEPGTKWIYSVMGYCLLGEIIERAAGIKAEDYITENIFLPCEMYETHWRRQALQEQAARYNVANETDLRLVQRARENGWRALADVTYPTYEGIPETAGGQMSTCGEMIHLGEMLLRNGYYHGRRVIGRKALEFLWTNLLGGHVRDQTYGRDRQMLYGAGVPIFSKRTDQDMILSENTIYHEGAGRCALMVDREEDFAAVFQTSFQREFGWDHRAVNGTASIIWSGIL